LLLGMSGYSGYINIVAVMQKFFDQAISGNWSFNPEHYENSEVPVSVIATYFLNTYKYGWKTSYYQNTYDAKKDVDNEEDAKKKVEDLLNRVLNGEVLEEDDCDSCKI